jgi:hypothetical protein
MIKCRPNFSTIVFENMKRTFSEIRQVNLGSMFDSQNLRIDNTNIALQTLRNKTIYLQIFGVKYQR